MAGPVKVHKNKLPFAIHSSSVNTGYAENFSASFGGGWDITNYHQDHVGEFENEPLQGPFTEEHVGGNQYRHQPLNTGNDNQLNRAEGFRLDTSNPGELRIYGPDFVDTAAPRATLLRGNSAKAPVNIRNIETTTGSVKQGNYRFKYEVIQTSGRKLNNLWLRESENIGVSASQSPYISGLVDFLLPDRSSGRNKTIIVERFNAPGGPEVSSRGVLDVEGEEYAPNNALPYRNILIREPHNELLTQHAGEFGQSSFDDDVPLWYTTGTIGHFHKTNRNTRYAPVTGANSPCQPKYDNWYVQHAIPSTDLRYAWITSSTITSVCELMGYQMSGAHTNRAGAYTDISFVVSGSGSDGIQGFSSYNSIGNGQHFITLDNFNTLTFAQEYEIAAPWSPDSSSYARVDNLASNFVSSSFSVSYWVFLPSRPDFNESGHLHIRDASNGIARSGVGLDLFYTAWGADEWRLYAQTTGSTAYGTGKTSTSIYEEQWKFITFTYDHATRNLRAYIDSVLEWTEPTVDLLPILDTYKVDLGVSFAKGAAAKFKHFAFWGSLLTDVDIKNIYNLTRDGERPKDYNDVSKILDDENLRILSIYDSEIKKRKVIDKRGKRNASIVGPPARTFSELFYDGRWSNFGNTSLLINNGPYQHPLWKQIRTGEHPVARKLRESNIISVANVPKEVVIPSRNTRNRYRFAKPKRAEGSKNYIEPPVSNKYKPMKHYFIFKGDDQFQGHEVTHTYANNLVKFANKELRERLGDVKYEEQVYDKLKKMYDNPNTSDENNPIEKYLGHRYSEVIWPKEENTFLAKTRGRTEYITDQPGYGEDGYDSVYGSQRVFWRDSFEDRKRTAGSGSTNLSISSSALNSQGYPIGFRYHDKSNEVAVFPTNLPVRRSVWPLDTVDVSGSLTHNYGHSFGPASAFQWSYNIHLDGGSELLNNSFTISKVGSSQASIGASTKQVELHSRERFFSFTIDPDFSTLDMHAWYEQHASPVGTEYAYLIPSAKYTSPLYGIFISTGSLGAGPLTISQWSGSLFDAGLRRDEASFSGSKPWYDSYDEYLLNIRGLGKDMSVVPEFNISEQVESAVLDFGGNFKQLKAIEAQISDSLFRRETNQAPDSIAIRAKGIKKLLPFNGFYPITRTVQLASLLSQSYSNNLYGGFTLGRNISSFYTGSDSNFAIDEAARRARLYSFLQPFYAPGIMYNTIKAAVAVDWPLYTASYSAVNTVQAPTPDTLNKAFFDTGFGGAASWIPQTLGADFVPAYRAPFESIIFPSLGIPKSTIGEYSGSNTGLSTGMPDNGKVFLVTSSLWPYDIYNANTDSSFHRRPFVEWDHGGDSRYSLASSNFFAEVVKFFLKDGKTTAFKSSPNNKWNVFSAGKKYCLDIAMNKSDSLIVIDTYNDGQVFANNVYSITGALGQKDGGRYFGWPFDISDGSSRPLDVKDNTLYALQTSHTDPSYAPFTPSYHEGEAIARISFTPSETRDYTLREVFASSSVEYINKGLDGYESTPAGIAAMNLDASVTLFGTFREKIRQFSTDQSIDSITDSVDAGNDSWVISTKLETPVLDFSKQNKYPLTELSFSVGVNDIKQNDNIPELFNIGFGRGMWSGYGEIPKNNKGIYLELRESFPEKINNYLLETTASLLQACGFTPSSEKIGQIADSKDISETILVIPFLDKPTKYTTEIDGKHFIRISDDVFETQLRNINSGEPAIKVGDLGSDREYRSTSVSKMIKVLQNHVVPPNMNFLVYDDIEPFIMYTLEFKHTLDQQDLADIWQGVMPKIAMNPELDEVEFEHPTGPYEFFENREVPQEMRFMVFKIKKKAEKNYFAVTADSTDDDRFQFDFEVGRKAPEYSYNWPYDFFSLVELAKVEATLEFRSDNKEEKLVQNNVPSPRQITKRTTTTSTRKRRR